VSLRRERGEAEVALIRSELTAAETTDFLNAAHRRLTALLAALNNGSFTITGQVPADTNVVSRVQEWLAALPPIIPVAPAAGLK